MLSLLIPLLLALAGLLPCRCAGVLVPAACCRFTGRFALCSAPAPCAQGAGRNARMRRMGRM